MRLRFLIQQANQVEVLPAIEEKSNRYTLLQCIRMTLQGKLYTGRDTNTGAIVAIKVVSKDLVDNCMSASGKSVLEDIKNEAMLMKGLFSSMECCHVIKFIDFFETDKEYWLVMQYAERGEFFDIISQCGRLDEEIAKLYFRQLCTGVQYLHEQDVVHLDLSLENLLMDCDARLVICDLGLARKVSDIEFPCSGHVKPGKIRYMAPEVFAGKSFSGFKADVFSAGVILWMMLTGSPPFEEPSPSDSNFMVFLNGEKGIRQILQKQRMLRIMSADAIDLLSNMLCTSENRYTIDEVLKHRWVRL